KLPPAITLEPKRYLGAVCGESRTYGSGTEVPRIIPGIDRNSNWVRSYRKNKAAFMVGRLWVKG
ncbi:hypothetical protein, partial [Moorena sp. SIO4G3]|uniref:hypothetical protein n=1 Tax=Moorena sp. SIO4G3 TaxID=2607821 RepID=UPI0025CFCB7D